MVDLNKIIQAKRTIAGFVDETPFAVSNKLSKNYNANVYLKEIANGSAKEELSEPENQALNKAKR